MRCLLEILLLWLRKRLFLIKVRKRKRSRYHFNLVGVTVGFRFLYVLFVAFVLACRGASKYDVRKSHSENNVEAINDGVFWWMFIYWLVTIFWSFALPNDFHGCGFWSLFWWYWFGHSVVQFLLGFVVVLPLLFILATFLYYFVPTVVCGYIDELKRQWGDTSKQKPK